MRRKEIFFLVLVVFDFKYSIVFFISFGLYFKSLFLKVDVVEGGMKGEGVQDVEF